MELPIKTESIKISQVLKMCNIVETGGQSKMFLENNVVTINGKRTISKSSKARPGDFIWINDKEVIEIVEVY
ncbi:hypothetical protein MCANUF31_00090 [Mycoplasmopsis canis UF31]|uniref:S4-like RNA binding protein n=1 Tax=Mycoplasmopsis canis TaxID=29555 RepID=A0A0F6ZL76_9BACT|nr:RNA-binding S4 domain-containing protein [Mycoplasmopsis canis]AKF40844.1 RNA-binding protein [Mycoplasmopsis canis]AMD80958.1 RNA-binding protein [Mycoplasmopsis canis PG 14]EIE41009.1 hypothetical protein MCANUF31_00090 [Mycoplasmopsis canis UF31]EIE41081.1 hypothetical protein MCANPG14_00090 [Mycoplasmopsis canis PG 14]WQQ12657.1 RNA-binding S4 domain-containing protein [Mycoplasmopsis canis]